MRDCTKCNETLKEEDFYKGRTICKECHKEYVYERRSYEGGSSKSESDGVKETIKTNPNGTTVNYELYNHLLKL